MPTSYLDVTSLVFGTRPFTVRDFTAKIGSLRATRLLSEMKTRGLIERIDRGRYRVLSPDERPDLRGPEWSRVNRLLLDSNLPMSWTGADAVRVWTGGRYTISPSAYLREFHIEVPADSVDRWHRYLRAHRVSTDSRRRIGSTVVITTTHRRRRSLHRAEPVISRAETLALIKAHRGLFANADKLIES